MTGHSQITKWLIVFVIAMVAAMPIPAPVKTTSNISGEIDMAVWANSIDNATAYNNLVQRIALLDEVWCADQDDTLKELYNGKADIKLALDKGCHLVKHPGLGNKYPHHFDDDEGIPMNDCDSSEKKMYEFPINELGQVLYETYQDEKKVGPDRVIFNEDCVICHFVTHRNMKKNLFRKCIVDP